MSADSGRDNTQLGADAMLQRDACSRALGIAIEVPERGRAVARMTVRDDMLNGFGVCHGGIVFALADTACAFACNAGDDETLSVSADIRWLLPVRPGDRLLATATEDERCGRHGFYTVRVHNQDEALVALFRGHVLSRERSTSGPRGSDTG